MEVRIITCMHTHTAHTCTHRSHMHTAYTHASTYRTHNTHVHMVHMWRRTPYKWTHSTHVEAHMHTQITHAHSTRIHKYTPHTHTHNTHVHTVYTWRFTPYAWTHDTHLEAKMYAQITVHVCRHMRAHGTYIWKHRHTHDATHTCTQYTHCLLYTSPSPRDRQKSRMPSSA